MEPDEQRMRKAAHLMVSSLAGSLALVTCKDPLRVSLMQQMRNMLQSNVDPSTLEQTVQVRLGSWLGTLPWLRQTCLCFHPPSPKLDCRATCLGSQPCPGTTARCSVAPWLPVCACSQHCEL